MKFANYNDERESFGMFLHTRWGADRVALLCSVSMLYILLANEPRGSHSISETSYICDSMGKPNSLANKPKNCTRIQYNSTLEKHTAYIRKAKMNNAFNKRTHNVRDASRSSNSGNNALCARGALKNPNGHITDFLSLSRYLSRISGIRAGAYFYKIPTEPLPFTPDKSTAFECAHKKLINTRPRSRSRARVQQTYARVWSRNGLFTFRVEHSPESDARERERAHTSTFRAFAKSSRKRIHALTCLVSLTLSPRDEAPER